MHRRDKFWLHRLADGAAYLAMVCKLSYVREAYWSSHTRTSQIDPCKLSACLNICHCNPACLSEPDMRRIVRLSRFNGIERYDSAVSRHLKMSSSVDEFCVLEELDYAVSFSAANALQKNTVNEAPYRRCTKSLSYLFRVLEVIIDNPLP